ncbi:erythromycin esterase family protein [Hymenobacter nivis]|uniref:Erythromycin esterase family protein n=1 Tax=Hymenobacter nivis TaxID=1850093 RepID=A0A502GS98_9BACT|nr:erythromycin esterase family protein [Hymenobacter nivis]TPG64575.1 hypothetical protein EAH73_15525 [Hymenobacter nivis]
MAWFRMLLLWGACLGAAGVRAQTPGAPGPRPVPARALRSLSPADTSFAELEFLRAEIGGARVVFLGEPTHGEGNVLAAKARLAAFLQQRLGFTTLAMESGFFELHKAQQSIAAGKSVAKNLASSVFPVWTATREFQAVGPLLGPDGLRLMGFDPQLSGDYSDDLADDLEDFLEPEKGTDAVDYELLGDVVDYMAAHYAVPPAPKPAEFQAVLAQADRLLRKAAGAPAAGRRTEAAFWQQCLRSLGALARDYAAHDPGAKTADTFVAADSNPRDAQMADNLLWYLRQHPAEKVICWGALPHFANHVEVLGSEELRAYQPMGRAIKTALGPNQVYIMGTLAGGGTHGLVGTEGAPVPPPAAGTLEAELLEKDGPLAFVSLKHDAPGLQLTTYAFDYQPLAGPWSEVVDGFLFFRSVEPPHLALPDSAAGALAAATVADTTAAAVAARAAPPGSRNPAAGRGGALVRAAAAAPDVSGVRTVRGQVLDARSRAGVPYASVVVPGQGKGTTANGQGRFSLSLPGPTPLQVSSLGYATAVVQSPRGNEELTVQLTPSAYALDEVRVPTVPPSPLAIMQDVIKNIPANYEQQDYATEVYAHRRISNFDTLRYETETVGRLRVPAGYRHFVGGLIGGGERTNYEIQQRRVLVQQGAPINPVAIYSAVQGDYASAADPVRTSPLFVARSLRRFVFKLDSVRGEGPEAVYLLSFAAKKADRRSTGTNLMGVYQGHLLVRQRDYAVLRYEALWQVDTAVFNGEARKNRGRATLKDRVFTQVFTSDRTTHVVDYAKGPNGRYYARRSVGQSQSTGRVLGKAPFYYQSLSELFFKPLPEAGPLPAPTAKAKGPATPVPEVPYRPEFWNTYARPGGALAAPATRPQP